MTKPISRNAPCPCGSGKKYKKCCLPKELEAERAKAAAALIPTRAEPESETVSPPRSKKQQEQDELWDQFEKANYEEKFALFQKGLQEGLLDKDYTFEMLSSIHSLTRKKGEYTRFNQLIELLRQEQPKLYEADIAYYNSFLIKNAIILGQTELIPELLEAFAKNPCKAIDEFFNIIDRLMYHGHVEPLIKTMTEAWPKLKRSSDILPFALDEFGNNLMVLLIFDYLDTAEAPYPDVSTLHKRFTPYSEIQADRLEQVLLHLSGKASRVWTPSDFGPGLGKEKWRDNIFFFSLEFIGELRRNEGVPYSKGEIYRCQLVIYLDSQRRSKKTAKAINFLLPRKDHLDRYLVDLLYFVNPQLYKAGCLMELMPHYLQFLSRRQFISEKDVTRILRDMGQLPQQLWRVLENYGVDTILLRTLQESWSFASPAGNQPGV